VDAWTRDVVLFDLDGVLADSRAAISGCINHALAAGGHPVVPEADLHRRIARSCRACSAISSARRWSPRRWPAASRYRERYATASLTDTVLTPGMATVLAGLAARRRLGVATSKPRAFVEPLLAALGVREHFTVVAGPELGAALEDKTATVAAALRALGARGGAMVGDTAFDMVAARAHGLRAVGVAWGIGTAQELRDAGADVLVSEPAELEAAVSPPPARP